MGQVDSSNHKSIKVEVEVITEITIRETIRTGTDQIMGQIVVTEDRTDKTEIGPDMNKITGEVTLEEMWEVMADRIVEESIETAIEMTVMTEAGTGLEKGCFPEIMAIYKSTSNSRSRSGSRASTNRDRIRCYKWREYNHFAMDCATSREKKGNWTPPTNV